MLGGEIQECVFYVCSMYVWQEAKKNMLYMRIPFSPVTMDLRCCVCCCVSWIVGLLPWHWITTGTRTSGQYNHHSHNSRKRKKKIILVCSLSSRSLFYYFFCGASPSISLFLYISLFVQNRHPYPLLLSSHLFFHHLSNDYYLMSVGLLPSSALTLSSKLHPHLSPSQPSLLSSFLLVLLSSQFLTLN